MIFRIIIITIVSLIFLKSGTNLLKKFSAKNLLASLFWFSASILYIFPESAKSVSRALGLGENLNTLVFFGFIVLFAIAFKTVNMIEKTRKDIAELNRKIAVKEFQEKYENQRNQKSL